METTITPELLIVSLQKGPNDWIAYGSRTINQIKIETMRGFDNITTWDSALVDLETTSREILFEGRFNHVAVATGTSQLSAIGALLDFFREEEKKDLFERTEREKRQADIARFGGEINEELVRKIVRWRKKQAKKADDIDYGRDLY
jgi:hypothetical protein